MKKFFTILTMALFFAGNAWGDVGDFYETYLTYYYNGSEHNKTCSKNDNLTSPIVAMGEITDKFSITGIYEKCSDDWGYNYKCAGGLAAYKINKSDLVTEILGFIRKDKTSDQPNNYEWQHTSEVVIATNASPSGKYEFEIWFKTYGGNWGDRYINNGDNYHFTYTILPPAATDLSISGAIKGSGTQEDPYVFIKGTNMTVSAQQEHTDDNSSLIVKFGSGQYSQTASMVINETGSMTVSAKYHNNSASLNGAEASTTVYYTLATWNVVYREHENLQSPDDLNHVEVDANNQAVLPNLTINTKYDLGLYDGVNFYSTTEDAIIDHLTPNKVLTQTNATNLQFETTYAGNYTITLDLNNVAAPRVTAAYPASGDAYIFGYFNNAVLNDEVNFTQHNGVVDVTFHTADKDEEFRIFDGGRRCTNITITGSMTLSDIPFLATGSNDIYKLHTTVAGKYRFKYTQSTHTLEIIYPNTITHNESVANGDIEIAGNLTNALPGEKIVVAATPTTTGYYLKSLKAYKGTQVGGEEVSIALDGDGNYYFEMPDASVYVTAEFTNAAVPTTDNHYFARSGFAYSAGMSIAASDITVTLSGGCGNLVRNEDITNWVDPRFTHIIQFDTPGANRTTGVPTGSYCQFVSAVSGQLTVALYLPISDEGEDVNMYVKEGTTRIYPRGNTTQSATKFYDYSFKVKDVEGVISDGNLGEKSNGFEAEACGTITFDVVKDQTYYVFCTNAAIGLQGFIFSPDVKAISGADYYTTFFDSRNGYVLPEGVEAFAVVVNGNTATLNRAYSGDDENNNILPHNCGVILRPTTDKIISEKLDDSSNMVIYRLSYSYTNGDDTNAPAAPANNSLKGTDEQTTTPTESGNNYYYKLSYDKSNATGSIGFYWGNENGSEFTNGKHKAYLVVPQTAQEAPNRLTIVFPGTEPGITTDVEEVDAIQATKTMVNGKLYIVRDSKVYDLNGRIVK